MSLERFMIEFQDHLAPKLDTYEQAIYLYIFRHSRLLGLPEVVLGFKSARRRMALGIGKAGTPIAEGRLREKARITSTEGVRCDSWHKADRDASPTPAAFGDSRRSPRGRDRGRH